MQGFGNVGAWAARLMQELGAKMVGVADAHGAVASENGIDAEKLADHVRDGGKVSEFDSGAEQIDPDELVALECDVFIPAALGGMLHADNAESMRCRMIVEGANSPTILDGVEFDVDLVMHEGECLFASVSENWPTAEPSLQETGLHCPATHDRKAVRRLVDLWSRRSSRSGSGPACCTSRASAPATVRASSRSTHEWEAHGSTRSSRPCGTST